MSDGETYEEAIKNIKEAMEGWIETKIAHGFPVLPPFLDDMSANYILTIAEHDHKTPIQVVGDMVREKIAVSR